MYVFSGSLLYIAGISNPLASEPYVAFWMTPSDPRETLAFLNGAELI